MGVPSEWSLADGSDRGRVLLFFHGGGYCSGSIVSHRRMVTEAGRAAGMRTLAVGYRLAPEHPFPAALEDASTAWRFLRRAGFAAECIGVGGDSAGGGPPLALLQAFAMRAKISPAAPGWSRSAPSLLGDAGRFAAAGAAEVFVTLEIWPDMIHAWPLWNARLTPGRRALASAGAFVRRHLHSP